MEEIEANIKYLFEVQNEKSLTIISHPYIYAYLTKGIISRRLKLCHKYKKRIKISFNNDFNLMEHKFFNKNGDEIKM